MPTHTKKLFIDNKVYYDHIKNEGLITKMDKCWKNKRRSNSVNGFRTGTEFNCYRNIDNLNLRTYGKTKFSPRGGFRFLSKIKRPLKNKK